MLWRRDETRKFRDNRPDVFPTFSWEFEKMKKILAAVAAAAVLAAPAFAALETGAVAPDFSAQGMEGGKEFTFKLSDALKKGPVVMYFFPAAFTPGCTAETKLFADAADQFKAAGATLVGVTAGAAMADGKMVNATENLGRLAEFSKEHCRDKFPMVAIGPEVINAYKVSLPRKPEWTDRTSFVVAKDSKIALAFTDPRADDHVNKTLEAVKALKP
jgi:peroxiredoxin